MPLDGLLTILHCNEFHVLQITCFGYTIYLSIILTAFPSLSWIVERCMSTILNVCSAYIKAFSDGPLLRFFKLLYNQLQIKASKIWSMVSVSDAVKGIFQSYPVIRTWVRIQGIPGLFTHSCCLCHVLVWQEWHKGKARWFFPYNNLPRCTLHTAAQLCQRSCEIQLSLLLFAMPWTTCHPLQAVPTSCAPSQKHTQTIF